GNGGAIIAWEDSRNGSSEVYAQRLNSSGNLLWTTHGVRVATSGPVSGISVTASDTGAIVAWLDNNLAPARVRAQRLASDSVAQWTAGGVEVATPEGGGLQIVSDDSAGAFLVWYDDAGVGPDIFARRIRKSGDLAWSAITISNQAGAQTAPTITPDGNNGALIAWESFEVATYDIYAQRISHSGTIQWTSNGVGISVRPDDQRLPTIVSDGSGGSVIAWQDDRNSNFDIYGQRILSSGNLADITPPAVPTLALDSTVAQELTISWNAISNPGDFARYRIYRSTGPGAVTQTDSTALSDLNDNSRTYSLSIGTRYYFRVASVDINGNVSAYSGEKTGVPKDSQPGAPANVVFSNPGEDSLTVSWDPGAAEHFVVFRREGQTPATFVPSDAITYTVGQTYGNSILAYDGSNSSFNATGLPTGQTQWFLVYSYSGTGAATNYNPNSAQGNAITLAGEPSARPTNPVFGNVLATSMNVSWTASDAMGYIVFARAGGMPTALPVDGTFYFPGDSIGADRVMFNDNTTDFDASQLVANTVYGFVFYPYNTVFNDPSSINYLTSTPLTASQTTLQVEPVTVASNVVFSNRSSTSTDVTFDRASGNPEGYVVLMGTSDPVPQDQLTDGVPVAVGASVGSGITVVHVDSTGDTTFTVQSLTNATQYRFAIVSYNGSGSATNYLTDNYTSASAYTLRPQPTNQPIGASFSNISSSTITLSFNSSGADAYLVLRGKNTTPSSPPVDGTEYIVGDSIGDARVISSDNSTLLQQSFLEAGTTYTFAIYSYNRAAGNPGLENYLTSNPLTGSASTLAEGPGGLPQNLTFENRTSSSITINFDPPAVPVDGYIVLRNVLSASFPSLTDGVAYALGQNLGGGAVVVSVGPSTTVIDTGLNADNLVNYAVLAFNGSGSSTTYGDVVTGSARTLAVQPTSQHTGATISSITSGSFDVLLQPSDLSNIVLIRAGTAPIETPTDGQSYNPGDSIGQSRVVHYSTSTGFFNVPTLSENTVYYLAAFSFAGSGASTNYLTTSPFIDSVHTLYAEPEGVDSLQFTDITLSSMSLRFTASTGGADGYLIVRGVENSPVGLPMDGFGDYVVGQQLGAQQGDTIVYIGTETSFISTGLKPGTMYGFNVIAFNGSGDLINYNTIDALGIGSSTLADAINPAIANAIFSPDPVVFGSTPSVTISCDASDNTGISNVTLSYRSGAAGSVFSTPSAMPNSGGNTYSGTIPSGGITANGIQFRIIATDLQNNRDTLYGVIPVNVPNNTISTNLAGGAYTSGFPSGEWRMISVPLDLDDKLASNVLADFGDPGNTTWRLFEGETDVSSTGTFVLGKGFWLKQVVVAGGRQITVKSGRTATVNDGQIVIAPGWHQIGNPFTYSVDWNSDTDADQFPLLKGPIAWDGLKYVGVDQTNGDPTPFTTLQPWNGYWVNNGGTSNITLTIDPTGALGKRVARKTRETIQWQVQLKVTAGPYEDSYNYIGVASDASEGLDVNDLTELPYIGDHVSLYFEDEVQGKTLTMNYLPPGEEVKSWTMRVEGTLTSLVHRLSFESRDLPDGFLVAIYDVSSRQLVTQYPYEFKNPRQDTPAMFKVFVGRSEQVQFEVDAFDQTLPSDFSLAQNYPNPFNPSTTIKFEVARAGKVRIRIYNTLGQEVATLVNRYYEPGRYSIEWDGRTAAGQRAASGMYIYRLEADRISHTRKMLLLK
ncbi:MAG: T9SS type A sorting domain-containing protein, partial [Bacteroidetes bacterium]|nr:T9SS type A sorting domain-containing protein [Bacteroidota bacterium]